MRIDVFEKLTFQLKNKKKSDEIWLLLFIYTASHVAEWGAKVDGPRVFQYLTSKTDKEMERITACLIFLGKQGNVVSHFC